MSVINQMLQKLEENRGVELRAAGLPPRVRPVASKRATHRFGWIFLTLAASAVIVAGFYATRYLNRPEPVAAPARPAMPAKAQNPLPPALLAHSPSASQHAEQAASNPGAAPYTGPKTDAAAAPRPHNAKPRAKPIEERVSKEIPPGRQADHLYHQALGLIRQGSVSEAESDLNEALQLNPNQQSARQTLVGLLIEQKRYEAAERSLRQGLNLNPRQTGFAMTLARLQVEMGRSDAALSTLKSVEAYAAGEAEFYGFMAVLLQRAGRHQESISYFRNALALKSSMANWWIGLGISLEKTQQSLDALAAFRHAKTQDGLSPELQRFADERIAFIERHLTQ